MLELEWNDCHQNSVELWGLYSITVEELDIDILHVLFETFVTRNSFTMLADICSCLPVSLHSSSIQDRPSQSWSAVCEVWWEIWTVVLQKAVTPNIHFHCHLKECVIDCGPVHAFWCFSFERFNGILGAMQVNGRSVQIQLIRKTSGWTVCLGCEISKWTSRKFFAIFFTRKSCADILGFWNSRSY